ncbi:MAG: class IV adenylate cyclase, partial [Bacteroidota bacterium]
MPKNLELKARLHSLAPGLAACRTLGARKVGVLRQTDTYFRVSSGRLKLRECHGRPAELIYYRRPDRRGRRLSEYTILPLPQRGNLRSFFSNALAIIGTVKKERTLYVYRNARIHLDRVTGLGTFVEFEVLVVRGAKQAHRLLNLLSEHFLIR